MTENAGKVGAALSNVRGIVNGVRGIGASNVIAMLMAFTFITMIYASGYFLFFNRCRQTGTLHLF